MAAGPPRPAPLPPAAFALQAAAHPRQTGAAPGYGSAGGLAYTARAMSPDVEPEG